MIEPDLMSQSEFARRWGLSRQYISRLALQGSLPMFGSREIHADVNAGYSLVELLQEIDEQEVNAKE